MANESALIDRVRSPSGVSVLLAIVSERRHAVELEWTEPDDGPWSMRVTFDGDLYEDALLELLEWAQRFGGEPERASFRVYGERHPVATVRVWP